MAKKEIAITFRTKKTQEEADCLADFSLHASSASNLTTLKTREITINKTQQNKTKSVHQKKQ